jgi:hypothetical protein
LSAPAHKLTAAERQEILFVANSPTYRALSSKQIVSRLADEGRYVAPESTFYRTLGQEDHLVHRERCRPTAHRCPREKVAAGSCQVWSWEITFRTPRLGFAEVQILGKNGERKTSGNTNGLLRFYFPKGTDFKRISAKTLQKTVDRLNNRPRKRLSYRTLLEVFDEALGGVLQFGSTE